MTLLIVGLIALILGASLGKIRNLITYMKQERLEMKKIEKMKDLYQKLLHFTSKDSFGAQDLIDLIIELSLSGKGYHSPDKQSDTRIVRSNIIKHLSGLPQAPYRVVKALVEHQFNDNNWVEYWNDSGYAFFGGCCGGSWVVEPGLLTLTCKTQYRMKEENKLVFERISANSKRFGNYVSRWYIPDHGTPEQLSALFEKGDQRDILYFLLALKHNEGKSRWLFNQLSSELKEKWVDWEGNIKKISSELPDWRKDTVDH